MKHLRDIAKIALPMLVAQLAVMANAVADTILVGHYQPTHLAAIGLGASVYFTVFVTLMGALQSLSPLIARRYGAGDHAAIGALVRQGIVVAVALSLPGIALLSRPGLLLDWISPPADVAEPLAGYLQAIAWGLPAVLISRVYVALAPAVGRPRSVMLLNLLSLAIKVPLTWALIHGAGPLPELGGPGCGVASSIVAWLVAVIAVARLHRGRHYARFAIFEGSFAPDRILLSQIIRLGIPMGLTFLVDVTAYTFMALFLARLGATVSGAHQIVSNLGAVGFMVPLSVGAATQILIGQSLGAGSPSRARSIAWLGVAAAMGLACVVAVVLVAVPAAIVRAYTSDPAVSALAVSLLPLLALYHLGDALQGVTTQALRGYHRAVLPMVAFVATMWGAGLGGGYVLAFEGIAGSGPMGAAGFWAAEAASVMALGITLALYLAHIARRTSGEPQPVPALKESARGEPRGEGEHH